MAAEVETGMANLAKHIENVRAFGIQPVVAINTRPDDEPELLELIKTRSLEAGAFGAAIHNGFGQGGEGTVELAEVVAAAADAESELPACSTLTTSRSRRRSRRSPRPSTVQTGSSSPPLRARRSRGSRSRGSRICRSAWRRRISRSRTTRPSATGRRASSFRSATSGSTRAPGCSCRSAATCCRCRASAPSPRHTRSTSTSNGETVGLF